jgi:hypothetical protein
VVVIFLISLIASLAEASVLILVVNGPLPDRRQQRRGRSVASLGRQNCLARSPGDRGDGHAREPRRTRGRRELVGRLSAVPYESCAAAARAPLLFHAGEALWHRQAAEKEGGVQVTVATPCQQSAQLAPNTPAWSARSQFVVLLIAAAFVDGAVTAIVIAFRLRSTSVCDRSPARLRRRSRFVLSNHFSEQVSAWA